jgi:membrane glycosyltransferase
MGRKVEWDSQDRGETSTKFREAFQRHWPSVLLGVLWTALLALTVPKLIYWFSPVIAGFVLAIPLSAWSSRTSWGERAKRHGLFLTPEEIAPPDLLRRFQRELTRQQSRPPSLPSNGLARVLRDDKAWDVHLSFLGSPSEPQHPLHQNHLERLGLKVRHEGVDALSAKEKRDLLLDPHALRELRSRLLPGSAGVLPASSSGL